LSPLFAVYLDDLSKLCDSDSSSYIILYADDILLIAPSLSKLECVLHACERKLTRLDMAINCKKSCCLRVGSRCDAVCGNIVSASGQVIAWVTEMRYLGVYVTQSRTFKCSLEHVKRSFYRAANAVFAQVGRVASEEVTLHLFKSKCLPVLLYGLEVCPLVKSQISSLDFAVNRFFMKLFNTSNIKMIKACQCYFSFELPSVIIPKRVHKFIRKFECQDSRFLRHYFVLLDFIVFILLQ